MAEQLISAAHLRAYLRYDVADDQAEVAGLVVAGWLREDTGRTDLVAPLDVGDPVWSAALELTALVVSNPELLASKTVGPTARGYSARNDRDAIRARVKAQAAAATGRSSGCFPPPPVYPDPVLPGRVPHYREAW